MKVTIGKHPSWFGPYQLAEKLCWWVKPVEDEWGISDKPVWVHNFGEWLAHGSVKPTPAPGSITKWDTERPTTWLYKLLLWFNERRKRKVKVKIDYWDTWNMDYTLGLIALPMLKQLQATKHGSPRVDDADVPPELRSTSAPPLAQEFDTDAHWHERWTWVLGEMIYAFECKCGSLENWEDQHHTGNMDLQWLKRDDNTSEMIHGPDHTHHWDKDAHAAQAARIENGFRLFGKYYQALWD